mgnify:CR=1 FL=1
MNTFIKKISFIILFLASCNSKEAPPNIVFIMSDDHAFQAVSAYGHNLNNTPNIDRIGREGAIFNKGFVTNSICAPSRAVMLTGKHSFVNGKVDNVQPFNWDQPNFAKELQSAGYETALIGKIHLKGEPQGFNHWSVLPGQGHYYNPKFIENGDTIKIEGHVTPITTNMTLDWLDNKRDKEKPFLLLYHQKAPHRNWMTEEKYLTLFDDKTFEPPANYFDDYEGMGTAAKEQEMQIDGHAVWGHDFKFLVNPITGKKTNFNRELARLTEKQKEKWLEAYTPKNDAFREAKLSGKELGKWKFNRYLKDYLRTIQSIDDGVGEVLNYLDENNLSENTIVVYTSDQGFYLGEHGWFDKRFIYDESFKTPLLIRWPNKIEPGITSDEMVQNLDFAQTFLEAAMINIPDDMQGESLMPLLTGNNEKWDREEVYYHYYEYPSVHMVKRHYGIVSKNYKLVRFYYDVDEWELYDRKKDPYELNNVYDNDEYKSIREDLHLRLESLRIKYKDSDELNDFYINKYLEKNRSRN